MTSGDQRLATLEACAALAATQPGGTLATMHAEDGTPYVTFVLMHMRPTGELLFGSAEQPQHARNIAATPEASVLIDNREVVRSAPETFHRVVVEGRCEHIGKDHPEYETLLEELRQKDAMAAQFTSYGRLYCLRPRRIVSMKGFLPERDVVEIE